MIEITIAQFKYLESVMLSDGEIQTRTNSNKGDGIEFIFYVLCNVMQKYNSKRVITYAHNIIITSNYTRSLKIKLRS